METKFKKKDGEIKDHLRTDLLQNSCEMTDIGSQ